MILEDPSGASVEFGNQLELNIDDYNGGMLFRN
jgi:hypothetical protein